MDYDESRIAFGRRMATLRRASKLTQEQLAELIEKDRVYVGYLEQGRRSPSYRTIYSIAAALDVPMIELFDFDGRLAQ